MLVNTAKTVRVVWPEERVTWLLPRTSRGPWGETVAFRFIVPEKLLRLVMLRKSRA